METQTLHLMLFWWRKQKQYETYEWGWDSKPKFAVVLDHQSAKCSMHIYTELFIYENSGRMLQAFMKFRKLSLAVLVGGFQLN